MVAGIQILITSLIVQARGVIIDEINKFSMLFKWLYIIVGFAMLKMNVKITVMKHQSCLHTSLADMIILVTNISQIIIAYIYHSDFELPAYHISCNKITSTATSDTASQIDQHGCTSSTLLYYILAN